MVMIKLSVTYRHRPSNFDALHFTADLEIINANEHILVDCNPWPEGRVTEVLPGETDMIVWRLLWLYLHPRSW